MSCDREFIDYDSHMGSSFGYPLPQDTLEMYHHQQNVSPNFMHHHRPPMQQHQIPTQQHQIPTQQHQIPTQRHSIPIQRHQIPIQRHQVPIQQHQISVQQHQVPIQQMRYPNPRHPGASNVQNEPPPLSYPNRMPSIPISVNHNRPYMHPQYRAQHMHLQQQEQQRRHQHMLQQNMINMQNHMIHRPQMRMNTPPMVVSPSGRQVPMQSQPQQQQHHQWRFHNVRSLASGWNNYSESTPPPLMPLECHLTESATPTPNSVIEEQGVDDFNDFDVTDLLRLTFGDENELNEQNQRKRRGSRSSGDYSPNKKHRRTKADLVADRNEKLLEQCTEFYIPLHNNNYPDHVRIFGKNILRDNLPNVPNMKLAPKNIDFYRIRNLGYLVTKKGICFSCLTDQCKFKSYDLDRFKEHLSTYHHVEGCGSREGYCKLCEKHCCGFSLIDEVDHIMTTHVKSIDKHPMHQILHSYIRKPKSIQGSDQMENFQEDTSNILNDMEQDITKRCEQRNRTYLNDNESYNLKNSKRGNRNNYLNYSIDEDYNPDMENDEEMESECDENIEELSSSEPEIDEFIQLSDEDDEEEEEENIVFADTESESEEPKRKKGKLAVPTTKNEDLEKNQESPEHPEPPESLEIEDIPIYMLNRIKMQQSIKSLDDEAIESKLDENIKEAYEELIKTENLKHTPKQKKRKLSKTYFARKRTFSPFAVKINKSFGIESLKELPDCRVILKRLEDESELEISSIQNTEISTKVIAVPINLPTPPSSENSRDSLPSPPLIKRPLNEQISKDIENDSGLSDHSISNKSVINEESSEKVMNEQEVSKISNADNESVEHNGNLRLTRRKFKEQILNMPIEKMKTRHSVNLQTSESSVDDKENSGNKLSNVESMKSTQSPRKPRVVRKQRFIKKFHKIDSFFQTSNHDQAIGDTKDNEVIEIQQSSDVLPLDNSLEESLFDNGNDSDLLDDSTDDSSDEVISILDPEDENELITLERLYPWINVNTSQKVQKTKRAAEILKKKKIKFSTYKCMRQKCSFFTTDFEKFKSHTESYRDGYNICSFCLHTSLTCKELFDHIESSHKYDRYQCNLCMYRASEKVYVECHQKRFHVCLSGKILKSPTQILMKSMKNKIEKELDSNNWKRFVLPYVCKTSECNKKFYSKDNYRNHLKQESENPDQSQHIDDISTQLLLLDGISDKSFKKGYYQCLHCEYGSDDRSDINNHMTDNHPNQLGFICRRIAEAEQICEDEIKDNNDETIEIQTRVEYIGISSFKVKIYKGKVDNLTAVDVVCAGDVENVQNELNDSAEIVEISNDKQDDSETSTFPIISEITHIDYF